MIAIGIYKRLAFDLEEKREDQDDGNQESTNSWIVRGEEDTYEDKKLSPKDNGLPPVVLALITNINITKSISEPLQSYKGIKYLNAGLSR